MSAAFRDDWRRRKSAAFDLKGNSTGGRTVALDFWGRTADVYANANLSIYSGQKCNARCAFCVEELRPASRGAELAAQKTVDVDDGRYFEALGEVLRVVEPLSPSLSITGGEASKDPRLPRLLRVLQQARGRRRTVTTNGSGLLDLREGRRVIDWIADTGVSHLNVSRAHPDQERNARLMGYVEGLTPSALGAALRAAAAAGTRPRLSCVLLNGAVDGEDGVLDYLRFARSLGVDNVIFRQLMKTDPRTAAPNFVTRYSGEHRVALEPLLDRLSARADFRFVRQIVGYYYYVEVWSWEGMDAVFEEADLARLEDTKRLTPDVVHELVFHPNGALASTWQPWDGVLGPRRAAAASAAALR